MKYLSLKLAVVLFSISVIANINVDTITAADQKKNEVEMGKNYFTVGNYKDALSYLERARAMDGDEMNVLLYSTLVQLYADMEIWSEMEDAFHELKRCSNLSDFQTDVAQAEKAVMDARALIQVRQSLEREIHSDEKIVRDHERLLSRSFVSEPSKAVCERERICINATSRLVNTNYSTN